MTDNSWKPQNVFADVVAQEEKHKAETGKTMSGRKTIVLLLHSSYTWIDENRNLNLFRHFRREVGLISPPRQQSDRKQTWDVMFRFSSVLLVLLTLLDAL